MSRTFWGPFFWLKIIPQGSSEKNRVLFKVLGISRKFCTLYIIYNKISNIWVFWNQNNDLKIYFHQSMLKFKVSFYSPLYPRHPKKKCIQSVFSDQPAVHKSNVNEISLNYSDSFAFSSPLFTANLNWLNQFGLFVTKHS